MKTTAVTKTAAMAKVGVMLGLFGALTLGSVVFASSDASALCMAYRPTSPAYWEAQKMMREGNPSEARRLFQQAAQYPGQAASWMSAAYVSKAYVAERAGEFAKAMDHLRMAMHEQPGNWSAAYTTVNMFEKRNQLHDALLAIRSFPKELANNPAMLRVEARLLEKIGDKAAAKRILAKLAGKNKKLVTITK